MSDKLVKINSLQTIWLITNLVVWYFLLSVIMDTIFNEAGILFVWSIHYLSVFGFGLLSIIILKNVVDKFKFLKVWIIISAAISFLLLLTLTKEWPSELIFLVSFLLGACFSLSALPSLSIYAEYTLIEKRGKISGITLLSSNFSAGLLMLAFQNFNLQLPYIISIAALWRLLGLTALMTNAKFESKSFDDRIFQEKFNGKSLMQKDKTFLVYFMVWLLFCLVDRIEKPIIYAVFGLTFQNFLYIFQPFIGSIAALIGGVIADFKGRRIVALSGFIFLGLAYAPLSIFSKMEISKYSYLILDSIGGGLLWVIFILIIWGDIAPRGYRESYYFFGIIPFFLTDIVRLLILNVFKENQLAGASNSAFSIASIFLFLAVLPLMFTPETLPEKTLKERELKKYIERAKKLKEKFT